MGNRDCGKCAKNLAIIHRITCQSLPTPSHETMCLSNPHVNKHSETHYLYRILPHHLSPMKNVISPLLNTFFTQFPQRLLLLQPNKI